MTWLHKPGWLAEAEYAPTYPREIHRNMGAMPWGTIEWMYRIGCVSAKSAAK